MQGRLLANSCTAYASESCNNCDDDGDGQVDEDLYFNTCFIGESSCIGRSTCVAGTWQCVVPPNTNKYCIEVEDTCGGGYYAQCNPDGTWGVCSSRTAYAETCNGCDDDRDGIADNAPGQGTNTLTQSCNSSCPGAYQTCTNGTWGVCTPPTEVCNGVDDDCDGQIDEAEASGVTLCG